MKKDLENVGYIGLQIAMVRSPYFLFLLFWGFILTNRLHHYIQKYKDWDCVSPVAFPPTLCQPA